MFACFLIYGKIIRDLFDLLKCNEAKGISEITECLVSKENEYMLYSLIENSPIISLKNCGIMEGNSGSPILNAKGEIIGVASHFLNKPRIKLTKFVILVILLFIILA